MKRLNRHGRGVAVLTGVQGAGKTELAAAYARAKLAAGWRLAAWVNAGDTRSLLGGLAVVADAAGLSDGSWRDAAEAGQAVRRWLEADGDGRVVVFDDAKDPDALRPFVPAGGAARVLITTTEPAMAELGTSVRVDVFSADQALALLAGRTGLADDQGAAAVAAELGYLPLALDQAAAVIASQRLGYEGYLQRLRALRAEERLTGEEGQPYPPGVAEAVLLSLDQVRVSDQTGVCGGLMEMMAVLSAAGVRRELLNAAGLAGVLASGGQWVRPDLVDRAIEWLSDHSLLTVSLDGDTAIVHPLVTQVLRQSLARQERLSAVCRATALALGARSDALDPSPDRRSVRDITEQMTALLDNALGLAASTDQELIRGLLRLRFLALHHLMELGDGPVQAIAIAEPLTAELMQMLGPNHPDTLNSRDSLAAAYQAAGRADEAIPLFQQTLVARERLLGPDHRDTLDSQNNLASACQDAGRVTEAILLFRLTSAAREQLLGPDHLSTVNSRASLAAAYRDAGRTDEAIPLFEQTLAVRERMLGPDHPDTLWTRNKLANAYRETGRIAEAIPVIEQTLATQERLLGVGHPRTVSSRNNLAVAYRNEGRPSEAIPLFEWNLVVCEQLFGADHPRTLSTRDNLAACQEAVQAEGESARAGQAGHRQDEKPGREVSD